MRAAGAMSARQIQQRLGARADAARVPVLQGYFKTGAGQYAEGDVFIGVTMPQLRALCRECADTPVSEALALLTSRVHEARLLALLLLVQAFRRGSPAEQRHIYEQYLAHTAFINNWDLVDSSAHLIVGPWLQDRSRAPLRRLAGSKSLWERRIAILATLHYIRQGEFDETFGIADLLIDDPHDLIHKAVGWMLREVGNRDGAAERRFLKDRYARMPRTMLRYAIERFPEAERRRYLTRPAPKAGPA
jgi:3-methyladenine DNA glycosylase AlkD